MTVVSDSALSPTTDNMAPVLVAATEAAASAVAGGI